MTRHAASLAVQVKPGAKAPGIVSGPDGTIVVRVREPATEGRANEAVRIALASALGVPKSKVTLVRGAASRHKAFAIDGLSADAARARIEASAQSKR